MNNVQTNFKMALKYFIYNKAYQLRRNDTIYNNNNNNNDDDV